MSDPDAALAEILNPLVSGYRRAGAMSLVAAVRAAGWVPASEAESGGYEDFVAAGPGEVIIDLIEASSLGTSEAKALRESVPVDVAARIVERSKEIRDQGYPTPDRAAYAAYQRWRARPNRDAYVHDAMLALATEMFEAGRVAEVAEGACGHPYHGGDGGPCPACGLDITEELA